MKYKLIKCYPGSPELGSIIDEYIYNAFTYAKAPLFPEFWEPVVEKEYEILSLISTDSSKQKGRILTDEANISAFIKFSTDNWTIHSIKRLSDGEIFTIGDQWKGIYGIHTINKIYQGNMNSEYYCNSDRKGGVYYGKSLKDLVKYKKPLLITEDGIEIFEGDSFYTIDSNFEIQNMHTSIEDEIDNAWFNKKAAEEYILLNKPCLSVNDILNRYSGMWREVTPHTLKQLVKEKQSN